MTTVGDNLWPLARSGQPVDAGELAAAVADLARGGPLDFRTRLLIRDSLDALATHWGRRRVEGWLDAQTECGRLRHIWRSDLGPAGFPSLVRRIMDATKPETVLQFFRDLGGRLRKPARLNVGRSTSLILQSSLTRHTEDIDAVDEVPADIRGEYDLLDQLTMRYGLRLTHFQSHYLPSGWQDRVHSPSGPRVPSVCRQRLGGRCRRSMGSHSLFR